MTPLCELQNVKQVYAQREVLDIGHLLLHPGEIIGLYGPNGSGKSTLLRILALVESPAEGRICFEGRPAHPNDLSSRRKVTLLSQSPYLLKRSVLGNVSYGLKIRGIADRRNKAREALRMVGLDPAEFAGRMWHELSGGEAQRVALAGRLALEPRLLLLDEPTAYLDEESAEKIRSAVVFAREQRQTALVLVSHDHAWLSASCDRILQIHRGRVQNS
jgi:tungstate transport system ATP-binding protein